MTGGEALLQSFYNHPLIYALYRGNYAPPKQPDAGSDKALEAKHKTDRKAVQNKLPSYIPSASFALAVMDMTAGGATSGLPLTVDRLSTSISALPPGKLRDMLRLAVRTSQNDVAKVQTFLEDWYNSAMDRVSGVYKRHTQVIVFVFSLVVCVGLNVNTVIITEALSQNLTLRQTIVAQADAAAQKPATSDPKALRAQIDAIQQTGLPIGWGADTRLRTEALMALPPSGKPTITVIIGTVELLAGWLITAFAITLGAPFWFDVLNKITALRSSIKPTENSSDTPSKASVPQPANAAAAAANPALNATPAQTVAAEPIPINPDDQDAVMALDPMTRPRED
jgi:hypothetical protein